MKTKKTVKKTDKKLLVIVEIPLPDGCLAMYAGKLVKRDAQNIVLTDAAWVASTGRRHLFFAGQADSNCEVEPYPADVSVELPAAGAIITGWLYAPLTSVR